MADLTREQLSDSLLHEVACSGALMIDERLDYVEVQIDKETWEEIQRWEESRLRTLDRETLAATKEADNG